MGTNVQGNQKTHLGHNKDLSFKEILSPTQDITNPSRYLWIFSTNQSLNFKLKQIFLISGTSWENMIFISTFLILVFVIIFWTRSLKKHKSLRIVNSTFSVTIFGDF